MLELAQRHPAQLATELSKELVQVSISTDHTKTFRAKVQRAGAGLYACIAIGAGDLSFVDSDTEWLTVEKKPIEGGLIMEIRGSER